MLSMVTVQNKELTATQAMKEKTVNKGSSDTVRGV